MSGRSSFSAVFGSVGRYPCSLCFAWWILQFVFLWILINHYMWSTCIIILLYEAYIFIKFVTHEFFAPLTACLMTRSIEWVTHPFSPVHFGWQKAHCYAKIRKCFGAKTPGITNYSAIMPKSGTCTSLLQPQSYMENLNAASKELWTPLGNNLLLKGKLLFEKLDHHARKDRTFRHGYTDRKGI